MLELKKAAFAGAEESGDVLIKAEPGTGISIDLESNVKEIFGEAIEKTIREILEQFEIENVSITVRDKGALDFVIRARLMCAICRSAEISYDWSGKYGKN